VLEDGAAHGRAYHGVQARAVAASGADTDLAYLSHGMGTGESRAILHGGPPPNNLLRRGDDAHRRGSGPDRAAAGEHSGRASDGEQREGAAAAVDHVEELSGRV